MQEQKMNIVKKTLNLSIQQSMPILVLIIIVVYTYAAFFLVPYIDFEFRDGIIYELTPLNHNSQLKLGDQLIQIGEVQVSDYPTDQTIRLFEGVIAGDIVPIEIYREEQPLTILYKYPGATSTLISDRLNSSWWIPYIFWLVGTATYLFIRPRNTQWRLLIAFSFLTSMWLAAGGGPSGSHIWGGYYVFKGALWLCLPVYLHLHWIFPKPLGTFPVWVIYLVSMAILIPDWLQILPATTYFLGFFLSIGGSLCLLVAHAVFQPEQRDPLRQLARLISIILLPIIITSINSLFGGDPRFVILALIALPFVPASYIYAIYRHQLGELEVRANRLIVLYLYITLLVTAVSIIITLLINNLNFPGAATIISLFVAVATGLTTILGFNRFERFVEQRILGMPVPPASLLQTYAAEITTKLDKPSLADKLTKQVLPSLLVRQSALLYYDMYQPSLSTEGRDLTMLFDLDAEDLPNAYDLPLLLAQANLYRLTAAQGGNPTPCPWVRLVLPLCIGERVIGIWLLGKRDPDDFYSQAEIPVLEALAAQTAVALANILQAQNLHALYQFNIDQQEQERNQLALDLHDDVLNQIGLLGMYVDDNGVAPQFFEVYDKLTERFRETIHGLRPVMLNYGLQSAFNELVDNVSKHPQYGTIVRNEIPACHTRYPTQVERHLYRIVQQATENALKHAEADIIRIYGSLLPDQIRIIVADNGIGVSGDETLDLSILLQRKHFGLAGMFERAELIGAQMHITSATNQGTQILLNWTPKSDKKGG